MGSRFLANKCTIASRIDAFSETPNTIFGEKLKDQVEERLKLYEDGTVPKKNLDVMKEAIAAVNAANEAGDKRKAEDGDDGEPVKKKKKKAAEEASEEMETETATIEEATPETPSSEKKKKKKKKKAAEEAEGDSQADLTAEVEQMEVDTAES